MLGFGPKLPITDEKRHWVDDSMLRLNSLLGGNRISSVRVVLPTDEFFPDAYDGTDESVERMFTRVCHFMSVPCHLVECFVAEDGAHDLKGLVPYWSEERNGAAGLYHHAQEEQKATIVVNERQIEDPVALVATLAHELGHVLLLSSRKIDRNEFDMEPLTDLVTIVLGLGVFTANSIFRFQQYQENSKQGWSASKLGYLSEETCAYALAKFAHERREQNPPWANYLSLNVKTYFHQSSKWLLRDQPRSR